MTAERQTCLKIVKMNTPTLSDCPQWVWSTETQYVPSPNSSKSAMDPTAQAQSIWPNEIISTNPDLPEIFGVSFPFPKKLPFWGGPKPTTKIHQAESNHHDTSGCLFFFCCPRRRTRYLWRNAFPTFPTQHWKCILAHCAS